MTYLRDGEVVTKTAFYTLLKLDMADGRGKVDPREWNGALDLMSGGTVVHAGCEDGPLHVYRIVKEADGEGA